MEPSKSIQEVFNKREDINSSQSLECTKDDQINTLVVIPPDGGWGWLVVMGAFLSFFVAEGIICAFGIFLTDMSKSFDCPQSQVALTGAIMTCFFCVTGPFVSALVNRLGYRAVAVAGSLIASTSCILTSLSPSLHLTFITHGVIGGFGFGLIYLPAVVAVGFYFERLRALATAIAVCGAGIGGTVLPLVLGMLTDYMGWRQTFRVMAGLSFGCTLSGLLYRPLKPIRLQVAAPKETKEKLSKPTVTFENESFFGRYHNKSHPTVADVIAKSSVISDTELTSTMTIYKPQKLAKNISSEFIMSVTSSRSSFRSAKADKLENTTRSTKNIPSKLSTVMEEAKEKKECCSRNVCVNVCGEKYKQFWDYSITCSCFKTNYNVNNENLVVRPLYRDDIFYSGSLMYLPEYPRSLYISQGKISTSLASKSKSTLEYNMLVTRTITQRELEETNARWSCSESIKRTLATMLDLKLLKSPPFILLTINAVLTSIGFYTSYMFIKDRAILYGFSENVASWLLSCIGLGTTIGRITCGVLSSITKFQMLEVSYWSLFIGGLATMLSGLLHNIWIQFGYAALYGLSVACVSALRTIIMAELLGLEKLTNAVGITLLFQGIASLTGTSISCFLRDLTGDYQMSFYFSGGCICVGSLVLIPVKKVTIWEHQRQSDKV